MFGKKKSQQELEAEFLKAAGASRRMPGHVNREKAQEAFDNLPPNSKLKTVKFEGRKKTWQ